MPLTGFKLRSSISNSKIRRESQATMKIESLLNPVSNNRHGDWRSTVTSVSDIPPPQVPLRTINYASPKPRSQKLPKDAPVFRKGDPKGTVQFPPHEAGDDRELKRQHQLFNVYPMGEIADYCHHIPYSSDKKTFLSKTGRDAFEGIQKRYVMLEHIH